MNIKPTDLNRLTQATGTRRVMEITREETTEREIGFISCVGETFIVMNSVTGDLLVNGLVIFPLASITQVKEVGPRSVLRHAVDLLNLTPAATGPLVLTDWESLLKSASAEWEVITCHLETRYPGECYIGLFKGIRGQKLRMHLINPRGELEDRVEVFHLPDLTKVEVGGRYESVLRMMWKQSEPNKK